VATGLPPVVLLRFRDWRIAEAMEEGTSLRLCSSFALGRAVGNT
jgi:hypothetical protein